MATRASNYNIVPLTVVKKTARKILTTAQLYAGIKEARNLQYYPNVPDLRVKPCGHGMEMVFRDPVIGKQGWLRAIFWIHEKSKRIFLVDLFWKKTNAISAADLERANQRIRTLKLQLKSREAR